MTASPVPPEERVLAVTKGSPASQAYLDSLAERVRLVRKDDRPSVCLPSQVCKVNQVQMDLVERMVYREEMDSQVSSEGL